MRMVVISICMLTCVLMLSSCHGKRRDRVMRYTLRIANQAVFKYKINTPIINQDDRAIKQAALTDALTVSRGGSSVNPDIELATNSATITLTVKSQDDARKQLKLVTAAMSKVFPGAGAFLSPDASTIFHAVDVDTQNKVLQIMEKRVNPDGLTEVTGYLLGIDRIDIEIPCADRDTSHYRDLLVKKSKLSFRLLSKDITADTDADGNTILSRSGTQINSADALKSALTVIDGRDLLANTRVEDDPRNGHPGIAFEVRSEKFPGETTSPADRFGAITEANFDRSLAIVLDNQIIAAPIITSRITSKGIITGNFTKSQATDLVTMLNAGTLPVEVQLVEINIVPGVR
jgi:preprotein translocase subunit SecD